MPVIPRTRSNSLERIAGMWPCLHPALRKKKNRKKKRKILAQTFATGLGGVAHFTLKLPHPVPSENEGGRRESQSASRDAELRPITSSQVRDYRGWFAVEPTAQRFPCQSWDGATVGWRPRARSRKLKTVSVSKRFWILFLMSWKGERHSRSGSSSATSGAFKLLPALTRPTSQVAV